MGVKAAVGRRGSGRDGVGRGEHVGGHAASEASEPGSKSDSDTRMLEEETGAPRFEGARGDQGGMTEELK